MLVGKVNRICSIYSDKRHRWMSTLCTAKYVRRTSLEKVPSPELIKYDANENKYCITKQKCICYSNKNVCYKYASILDK